MAAPLWPQITAMYKTYLKETLVESLRVAWAGHADTTVRSTKVDIEFPLDKVGYPAIIVHFYERDLPNVGVGHFEYQEDPNNPGSYIPYQHMLYHGDVEYQVLGLSSYDRDIVSDALVQTFKFDEVTIEGKSLRHRVWYETEDEDPYSVKHYINLNLDNLQGFGESQTIAPWMPEDVLVYQVSYRIPVMGEVISPTPTNESYGLIDEVDPYWYMGDLGETKPDPDPDVGITPWTSETDIIAPPQPGQ